MSDHVAHHGPSLEVYQRVFWTLMLMTVLTVGVAFLDLGALNTPVALGIACFKASIVVLFFMHVAYGPNLTKVGILVSLFFLGVMIVFILSDVFTRTQYSIPLH